MILFSNLNNMCSSCHGLLEGGTGIRSLVHVREPENSRAPSLWNSGVGSRISSALIISLKSSREEPEPSLISPRHGLSSQVHSPFPEVGVLGGGWSSVSSPFSVKLAGLGVSVCSLGLGHCFEGNSCTPSCVVVVGSVV